MERRRRRAGRALALALVASALLAVGPAGLAPPAIAAVPAPAAGPAVPAVPPPPDPSPPGGAADRAAQVGRLVGRVAALRARLDGLRDQIGHRRELANRALVDDVAARGRADATARDAAVTRGAADVAVARAEQARARVDAWVAAWFQQADVTGAASVLSGSTTPAEVLERAGLRDAVTAEQLADLDAFERERVAAANADSTARAAAGVAAEAADLARAAHDGARRALAGSNAAAEALRADLARTGADRDAAQGELRALEQADAALAAQRRRAEEFEAATTRAATDADAAEAGAARTRLAGTPPTGPAVPDRVGSRVVLDRALSMLGTVYAWGGGDADGPTRGIRDGGVADAFGDFDKVGFDCSGLVIYAFAGVGRELPHYSGYQAAAGPRFPLAQRRPGDLLFWADGDGVHHVALYLGDNRMIEAPRSGEVVRVTRVRFDDEIVPTVTRLL